MFVQLIVCALFAIAFADEGQREVVLFHKVDTNHDDYLNSTELDAIFLLFDVNNDTKITPTEFVNDWVNVFNIGGPQEAQALFTRADTNDDGYINVKDVPAIFHFFDTNDDGQVDISEFLTNWGALKREPANSGAVSVDIG